MNVAMEVERGGQILPKVFSPTVIVRDGKGCFPKVLTTASWIFYEPYAGVVPTENDTECGILDLSKPRQRDSDKNHRPSTPLPTSCEASDSSRLSCAVRKTASQGVVPFKKRTHLKPDVDGSHVIKKEPPVITAMECLNSDRPSFQSQPQAALAFSTPPLSSTPSPSSPVSLERTSLCSSNEGFRNPLNSCSTANEFRPECFSSRILPFSTEGFTHSSTLLSRSTSPERAHRVPKPSAHNTNEENLVPVCTSRHQVHFPDFPCPGELGRDYVILSSIQTKPAYTGHGSPVSQGEIGSHFGPKSAAFSPGETADTQTGLDRCGRLLTTATLACGPCCPDVGGYCSEPGDACSSSYSPRPLVRTAPEEDSDRLSSHSCPSPSNGRVSYNDHMMVLHTKSSAAVQDGGHRFGFLGFSDPTDPRAWLAQLPAKQTTLHALNAEGLGQEIWGLHSDDELRPGDMLTRSFQDAQYTAVPTSFLSHHKCFDSPKSDRSLHAQSVCKRFSADPPASSGFLCAKRLATDPCSIALTRADPVLQGGNSWTQGDLTSADYHEQKELLEKGQTRKDLLRTAATDIQKEDKVPTRGRGQPHGKRKRPRQKTYPCSLCHVTCSNRGQLLGHLRTHTGERPFPCSEPGCRKTFVRNEELTRHRRIHSGERPYVCATCCKAFTRKDHLNKHLRVHAADVPE